MKKLNAIKFVIILAAIIFVGLILRESNALDKIFTVPEPEELDPVMLEEQQHLQRAFVPDFEKTQEVDIDQIQIVAQNLQIPWEIVWLPDNSMLVTQRPGILLRINEDTREQTTVRGVDHIGEGGLLGMALHPNFSLEDTNNNWLYLYLTTRENDAVVNRVVRYQINSDINQLKNRETIIDNIPGDTTHNGGRLAFGPDGYLYITTGDAADPDLSQDTNSLAGKILRVTTNGDIPEDNPFNNPVYSYGHRNPQGLAWDSLNQLWASEHGPIGRDEINLIEPGKNYGWPAIMGDEEQEGMEQPIIHSGIDDTWAPSAVEITNNTLFFAGLRGSALYSAEIFSEGLTNFRSFFNQDFGRLRLVREHQGWIYLATNNTDGRGTAEPNDDRIIRINLEELL